MDKWVFFAGGLVAMIVVSLMVRRSAQQKKLDLRGVGRGKSRASRPRAGSGAKRKRR